MTETDLRFKLRGSISTTHYGHQKLIALFNQCREYFDTSITVCFRDLTWIDANMAALLQAIVRKLEKENNLELVADLDESTQQFRVLFGNGLFESDVSHLLNTGTSIRLKEFYTKDNDDFVKYIENDFIDFPNLSLNETSKETIIQSLIEVFTNYEIHAKAHYPIFLCGQYYPTKRILKFTIVDLGIGFLKPIQAQVEIIDTYAKAIDWALVEGNTTKTDAPGGLGLCELRSSMEENNGSLEIVSGNAYKACGFKNGIKIDTCKTMNTFHIGTTINLVFYGV